MKTSTFIQKVILLSCVFLLLAVFISRGQFYDCSTGLLQSPSAEMNESGTFMITTAFLNKHLLPEAWGYHTFGYGINITFWSRLEIGYVMTIFDGKRAPNPNPILFNQDRHFCAKVLILRENEFGIPWMPSLAIGTSDPLTAGNGGARDYFDDSDIINNNYFNRYYLIATKHFNSRIGAIGGHLGYQYSRDQAYKGVCAAIDWMPIWLQKENVVRSKLIAEFDGRTFNVGAIVSLWRDHFDAMIELQAMKWVTAGIRYKLVLKS